MTEAAVQPARRGPIPTSATVRKALLRDMLARAQAGSAEHAAALVRLSLEVERAERNAEHRGARGVTLEEVLASQFNCARRQLRLTPAGCAKLWISAAARRQDPSWGTHACVGCPVGAANAGKPIAAATWSAAGDALRAICPRCLRSTDRMIQGRLCPSCYNRDREARIGRNAKGRPPQIAALLHVPPIPMIDASGVRAADVGRVTSVVEAMITAAKASGGPILFTRRNPLPELIRRAQAACEAEAGRLPHRRQRSRHQFVHQMHKLPRRLSRQLRPCSRRRPRRMETPASGACS